MSHLAAVLARDRSSLSVSCEPAFLQALLVQTDIDPGSPRESAAVCLAKSGRVRRTRTAGHGTIRTRALITGRPNFLGAQLFSVLKAKGALSQATLDHRFFDSVQVRSK